MSLPTTQAAAIALLTAIVGIAVGFIPNLATYQAEIISVGGVVLGAVYAVINAVEKHGEATVKAARIKAAGAGPAVPPVA